MNGELALHVDIERSQEQAFKKQLTLLIGAIQGIALHKVETRESQKQLKVLLSFLLDHMESISHLQGEIHAAELAETLAQSFEIDHQGSLQEAFQAIYHKRVEGELTPDLSRDFLVKVLGLFPDLHQVKKVLLDLNLEGIDD
ncbi:hypothetical protein [Pseudobacteriovorax antillogorgiicola]|uniref:hypothetical protein n=1 Tax=Pseudobacteriovorax antillogorgiicola TaxID=1513793 RepID=UPI0010489FF3|nr:hypothetical protein [Pseudobacteriovorax antillogorgiicola]